MSNFLAKAPIGNRRLKPLTFLLASVMLTSCASVETALHGVSRSGFNSDSFEDKYPSVTYYLPKRNAKFSIERTMIPTEDLEKNLKAAKEDIETTKAATVDAMKNYKESAALLATVTAGGI
jgi:hypothetical protein